MEMTMRRLWKASRAALLGLAAGVVLLSGLLHATSQTIDATHGNWGLDHIDRTIDNAFNYQATGMGINIFIVGTGVKRSHEDFGSRANWVGDFCTQANPARQSAEVDSDPGYLGHDTHVASLAAGQFSGVAKSATIYSLRTTWNVNDLDINVNNQDNTNGGPLCRHGGQDGAVVAAFNWIINSRLKPGVINYSGGQGTDLIQGAIHSAIAAGYLVTLSGGSGPDTTSVWGTNANANVLNEAVIAGASNPSDQAVFKGASHPGYTPTIYAPGDGTLRGANGLASSGPTDYGTPDAGDSWAAPFVAGVAALYLEHHRNAAPPVVRQRILDQAGSFVDDNNVQRKLLRTIRDVQGDIDGDGYPDLVWRNAETGANVVWYLDGNGSVRATQGSLQQVNDPAWQLVTTADLNGDGYTDAVWRNTTDGTNQVWFLNGTTIASQVNLPQVADLTWQLVASADINQDGAPDLIWRNQVTGGNHVWYMNGATALAVLSEGDFPTVSDLSWTLAASADMNGDGKPDLLWRNVVTGDNLVYYMNGTTKISQGTLQSVPDLAWKLAAALDVNNDGVAELFWRNTGTGENRMWTLSGQTVINTILPTVSDQNWRIAGPTVTPIPSDFNGDRHPDLVWRNTANGDNLVWYLNGPTLTSQAGLPSVPDLAWKRVATADMNGDGHPDLIWRNTTNGDNLVWLMNGTTQLSQVALPNVPITWRLVAAADINQDAKPDLIWRNTATGENVVWYMNGTTFGSQVYLPTEADLTWSIAAAADVNGDGHPDLIWRNTSSGANVVWFMAGASRLSQGSIQQVADLNWQIADATDVNGDSHPDLIWRNASTGANVVWYLNGTTFLAQVSLTSVPDTNWILHP